MNTDYVIYIATKHGRTTSYRKEKNGWSQTAATGIVRQLSGDQLLSHLLPPLAGDQPSLASQWNASGVGRERMIHPQISQICADYRNEAVRKNLCKSA
jgi:hypothetical protein